MYAGWQITHALFPHWRKKKKPMKIFFSFLRRRNPMTAVSCTYVLHVIKQLSVQNRLWNYTQLLYFFIFTYIHICVHVYITVKWKVRFDKKFKWEMEFELRYRAWKTFLTLYYTYPTAAKLISVSIFMPTGICDFLRWDMI